MTADILVGEPHYTAVDNAPDVVKEFNRDEPLNEGEVVAISISPTFFGRQSTDGRLGFGLFGSILPIKISGTKTIGNHKFGFEVFLENAKAAFVNKSNLDLPQISIELTIDRGKTKVWSIDDSGSLREQHPVEGISGEILIDVDGFEDADFTLGVGIVKASAIQPQRRPATTIPIG